MAERTRGERPRRHSFGWARVAPWRGHKDVAHLVLAEGSPPPRDHVEEGVEHLRRAWRIDRSAVLDLDRLAFDDFWRLETDGLADALHATPAVRFRIGDRASRNHHVGSTPQASSPGAPVAYAITGRAGRRGYLQRIAVHPDGRRMGWGQTLVFDALRWLQHHDANRALVNTQWTNEGALALYESCGFRRLPVGLCVLDRTL